MDLRDQEDRAADRETGKREGSVGRVLVKLKHSKPAPELSPSPEIDPAGESSCHRCKVCGKSFSSGKALGGHMSSAHVQPNKDCSYKKLKSRIHEEGQKKGSGLHGCGVCGRSFPSEKSLYGHMRCHPERGWRGMNPPPVRVGWKNSWSVKAKRGRPDQSLKQVGDEVNIKKRKRDESESEGDLFLGAIRVLASCFQRWECENGVKNEVFDQLLQSDNLHVCVVCDKGFPTRRAIGGHRKIHSNKGCEERVLSVREFDLNMVPD